MHFLIHFLVVLIYGGFWEILGPLTEPVDELCTLLGALKNTVILGEIDAKVAKLVNLA